ncbi:MAG TPA: hypothetical protein VHO47_03515 [Candidatus Babeliales bacterium]|nr:hypothetical protein [Candidatus Babeliales bacterium]
MNFKKNIIYGLILSMAVNAAYAMESSNQKSKEKIKLLVIPGQNGLGGGNIDKVLPQLEAIAVDTPRINTVADLFGKNSPDLGQGNCINLLKQTMEPILQDSDAEGVIIHGSSQGTATAINYTAENQKKVKALIMEAVLGSGNSAIYHTVKEMMSPKLANLPLSYYWMPYFAKAMFPFYSPGGKQPILNADKIPTDIPVVIIHNKNDPQLAYSDAQALYAKLVLNGNKNVYLMPMNRNYREHVVLLKRNENEKEIKSIQTILHNHRLLKAEQTVSAATLKEFQPALNDEFHKAHSNLVSKEEKMRYVDFGVKTTTYAALCYCAYKIYKYLKPQ